MINFSQVLVRGLRELFPWGLQYSDVSRSFFDFWSGGIKKSHYIA